MVDAKYVNMSKINVGYDGDKLIDLSGIDIGFTMDEFQKILDERKQTLRALWIARADKAREKIDFWQNAINLGFESIEFPIYGYSKGIKRKPEEWQKIYLNVEDKCIKKANEYK